MNWPMTPGQNIIGAKAPRVVRVEATTGQATSSVPARAAWVRSAPSCMWR
jgi:hypothetical protein